MTQASPKLTWCIVRLDEDTNWWVDEISDEIHWDVDGLSIVDPRQFSHVLDLVDSLRDYGFIPDVLESAFLAFKIQEAQKDGRVRLVRSNEPLLESEGTLFALPDIVDEEKGPYADLLNHVTKLRVKMLNDLIDFEKFLTIDELEDELREKQNTDFMEGNATHVFDELTNILEYVPEGYEIEPGDEDVVTTGTSPEDQIEDDFPDVDEESIEEDETMKWDEDEESQETSQ